MLTTGQLTQLTHDAACDAYFPPGRVLADSYLPRGHSRTARIRRTEEAANDLCVENHCHLMLARILALVIVAALGVLVYAFACTAQPHGQALSSRYVAK
jgi:hypothetical protein